MSTLFRALIGLYPAAFRRRFGPEMVQVLADSYADLPEPALQRFRFLLRETRGLVLGAVDEHARNWLAGSEWLKAQRRRLRMRSEFRYPRAMAPMMLLILGFILFSINKARVVVHAAPGEWLPNLPIAFGIGLVVACLAGVVGWLLLHATHRSGVHRLSEAQTWPLAK